MTPEQLAEILITTIKAALAPVRTDLARLEAALGARDTTVSEMTAIVGTARERLASLEARAPVPGPAGQDGAPGRDGTDGVGFDELGATFDGARTIALTFTKGPIVKTFPIVLVGLPLYAGVYTAGAAYMAGDVVTWAGSTWYCRMPTGAKPGEHPAWQLMVKAGRDLRPDRRSA